MRGRGGGGGGGEGGGGEGEQAFESSVCIITADFAMQNVIMQVRRCGL